MFAALLSIPVSTANAIYYVSFITLLIGALVVLLSVATLAWSNSIRERDAAERLAQDESNDARTAQEAAKKAQADLAEATKLLAQADANAAAAQKEAAEAKAKLQEGTAGAPAPGGREITLDNRELFIDFVKTVPKGRVVVEAISSDVDAVAFAHEVSDMLTGAGYTVVENFGSRVLLGAPPTGVEMRIRTMEDQPVYAGALQKGLEFIGIPTSGNLDNSAGDSVIIFVGTKP